MLSKLTEHLYLASHLATSLKDTPILAASTNWADLVSRELLTSSSLRYCSMPSSRGFLYLNSHQQSQHQSPACHMYQYVSIWHLNWPQDTGLQVHGSCRHLLSSGGGAEDHLEAVLWFHVHQHVDDSPGLRLLRLLPTHLTAATPPAPPPATPPVIQSPAQSQPSEDSGSLGQDARTEIGGKLGEREDQVVRGGAECECELVQPWQGGVIVCGLQHHQQAHHASREQRWTHLGKILKYFWWKIIFSHSCLLYRV